MEIALLLVGMGVGSIFTYVILKRRQHSIGTIRVDRSIPDEEPYLFLELNSGVGEIMRNRQVLLDVKVENYISQD